MTLDSNGILSVVELVLYIPLLVLTVGICIRHGVSRTSGWVYTAILCLVRVIGSICQLVSETSPSKNLLEAVLILDSIGLSPLLLATLGMLSRL